MLGQLQSTFVALSRSTILLAVAECRAFRGTTPLCVTSGSPLLKQARASSGAVPWPASMQILALTSARQAARLSPWRICVGMRSPDWATLNA